MSRGPETLQLLSRTRTAPETDDTDWTDTRSFRWAHHQYRKKADWPMSTIAVERFNVRKTNARIMGTWDICTDESRLSRWPDDEERGNSTRIGRSEEHRHNHSLAFSYHCGHARDIHRKALQAISTQARSTVHVSSPLSGAVPISNSSSSVSQV